MGEGFRGARLDRDAGGHGVSSVLDEVLLAFPDEGVDVQARGGAGAAHEDAIVVADDHAGTVAVFDEARGHDADHAAVPVLAPDDVDVLEFGAFRELLDGGGRDLFVVGPPDVVEPVEVGGEFGGTLLVAGCQQVDGLRARTCGQLH